MVQDSVAEVSYGAGFCCRSVVWCRILLQKCGMVQDSVAEVSYSAGFCGRSVV